MPVRDCFPADHFATAATTSDHPSFRTIREVDVADQLHRVHFAIHHEPCFPGGLEHQFSPTTCLRRAERSFQCHLRPTNVFPVKPVVHPRSAKQAGAPKTVVPAQATSGMPWAYARWRCRGPWTIIGRGVRWRSASAKTLNPKSIRQPYWPAGWGCGGQHPGHSAQRVGSVRR